MDAESFKLIQPVIGWVLMIVSGVLGLFLAVSGYLVSRMIAKFDTGMDKLGSKFDNLIKTVADLDATIQVHGERSLNHEQQIHEVKADVKELKSKVERLTTEHHGYHRGSHL